MIKELEKSRLVIFDLDGTLADAFGDIAAAANHALAAFQFPPFETSVVRRYVGGGVRRLMKDLIKIRTDNGSDGPSEKALDRAVGLWKEYYLEHPADHARLYPGAREFVARLRDAGVSTALLSNKPQEPVERIAERLFMTELFDDVIGDGGGFQLKPSPEAILHLMKKRGAPAKETWMVGDGEADAAAAKAAGCRFLGVAHGLSGAAGLEKRGAERILESFEKALN